MDLAIIEDGYTMAGYIAAMPGVYPAVSFSFRPALLRERQRFLDAAERPGADANLAAAELLAAKLQQWDVRDSQGQAVKIAADSLQRLKPRLFDRLFNVVIGAQASDPFPDGKRLDQFDEAAAAKN